MKVIISLKKMHASSSTRGIGVYTRELIHALQKKYLRHTFIPTSHQPQELHGDLVHYPYFDPFFLTLKLFSALPTVLTIHDLIPLRFPKHFRPGWRGKIKWWIQKARARKVDHIITDSHSSKQDILNILQLDPSRVSVIPLGPNRTHAIPMRLAQKISQTYQLPAKYLLYVGDINWNKNVPGLIKSFAKLTDPTLHLVLVGKVFKDAPKILEYQKVEQAIKVSGKSDRIHKLGYIPTHHLAVIYTRATLYVQPSWYEGFGLPVLEAMKLGCPVASSNRGSLKEIGGEAVAYFDPAKNMTTIISELLASPSKLQALKDKGIKQSANFTWAKTAELTYKVYEQVLSTRSVS